jgi:hypothetical protein
MSFSDIYENNILNLFLHGYGFAYATWGIGLATDVTDDDTGLSIDEVDQFGYSRITHTSISWTVSTAGSITNLTQILWPTVFDPWGRVTHFVFFDTIPIGTGDPIFYGILSQEWNIEVGSTPKFDPGEMVITLD